VVLITAEEIRKVMEDGRTNIASGKFEDAVQCFDWVLGQDPNNAEAWNGKGTALTGAGKAGDALQCFDMAIQLNPDLAFAWRNKGKALEMLGRDGEAQECYVNSEAIANRMAQRHEAEAQAEEMAEPKKKKFGFWGK